MMPDTTQPRAASGEIEARARALAIDALFGDDRAAMDVNTWEDSGPWLVRPVDLADSLAAALRAERDACAAERDALQSRLAALEAVLPDLTRLPVEIDERALYDASISVSRLCRRACLYAKQCEVPTKSACLCARDASAVITAYCRALVEGK